MLDRSHALVALALAGSFAACDARGPTEPGPAPPVSDAGLHAPTVLAPVAALRTAGARGSRAPRVGPARAVVEDGSPDGIPRPLQQIFNPRTRVGFDEGYAWALGIHEYIGNVGAIETTAHLTYLNQHVGSQMIPRQQYTPFLIDFGQLKQIWAQSKVYSDHECGLEVQGSSKHEAWWQFYQGRSVAQWGVAVKGSQASPEEQPRCQRATGQSTTTEAAQGMTCYYLITYDLDTLEIVHAELLQCTTGGTVL